MWDQGYQLAREFLESQHLPGSKDHFIDVEGIVKRLGIEVREVDLTDETVRGVSVASPKHRPGILLNRRYPFHEYPSGARFTLAHELCHILYDRSAGRQLALASGPWAPRDIERRANAFGAMLLMPSELIRKAITSPPQPSGSFDWLLHIARTLKTSVDATIRHLTNLGYVDEAAAQRLQVEFEKRAAGDGLTT